MKLSPARPRAFLLVMLLGLAGCGGATPHPSGWRPAAGPNPHQWSTGRGNAEQTFSYRSMPFNGTLQDLASAQVADVILRVRGAHFDGSRVFRPCPGLAAVATFRDGQRAVLVRGFAVQGDRAVLVTYVRPLNTAIAPAVEDAFRQALCVAPG